MIRGKKNGKLPGLALAAAVHRHIHGSGDASSDGNPLDRYLRSYDLQPTHWSLGDGGRDKQGKRIGLLRVPHARLHGLTANRQLCQAFSEEVLRLHNLQEGVPRYAKLRIEAASADVRNRKRVRSEKPHGRRLISARA